MVPQDCLSTARQHQNYRLQASPHTGKITRRHISFPTKKNARNEGVLLTFFSLDISSKGKQKMMEVSSELSTPRSIFNATHTSYSVGPSTFPFHLRHTFSRGYCSPSLLVFKTLPLGELNTWCPFRSPENEGPPQLLVSDLQRATPKPKTRQQNLPRNDH